MRSSAYLTLARFSGDPDRLLSVYESSAEVMDAVGRDHGLLVHAAGRTDSGMLVVNLWPSRTGSVSAAGDPRRLRSLAASGLAPDQIEHEHHDVACALLGVRPLSRDAPSDGQLRTGDLPGRIA